MRKSIFLGAAATLLGMLVGLTAPAQTRPPLLSYKDILARRSPLADRRIAYGPLASQFGELWLPRRPRGAGVVVLIHGGCWRADLPGLELMNPMAAELRRRGLAVWNIEYRRLGDGGGYPQTFDDVAKAVDFLRVLSRSDHLDLGRVVAVGHSAGGHLAAWAAGRRSLPASDPRRGPQPLHVAGVVTLAGINDLADYRARGPDACGGPTVIDRLIDADGRGLETALRDTSPPELLPLRTPQAVVSGELDPIVPVGFGEAYAEKARAAGDKVIEVAIPASGHFELIDPTSFAWPRVAREIERLARK